MGKFVSGPGTIPVQIKGQPISDMIAMSFMEQPISTIFSVYETQTFSDVAIHDMADFEALEGRTSPISVALTAHDDVGGRSAVGFGPLSISRQGTGVLTLSSGLISGAYTPNVAPWNTITATANVVNNTHFVIQVGGLAGVTIRWAVWVGVMGAQGR